MAHRLQAWSFLFLSGFKAFTPPSDTLPPGSRPVSPPPPSVLKHLPDRTCTGAAYEPPAAWPPGHRPPSLSPSPAIQVRRAGSQPTGRTAL